MRFHSQLAPRFLGTGATLLASLSTGDAWGYKHSGVQHQYEEMSQVDIHTKVWTNLLCHTPSSILPPKETRKAALAKGRAQKDLNMRHPMAYGMRAICQHHQFEVGKFNQHDPPWHPMTISRQMAEKKLGPLNPSVPNLWTLWFNTKIHQFPIFDPYPYDNSSIETP